MNKKTVNYMLRRVLPMWKPQEAIDEGIGFCRQHHIDEMMWKDESSGAFHELLTIPEVELRAKWLQRASAQLWKIGVKHSINVMTSLGHGDYGQNAEERHPGLEFFVDYNGNQSKSCACPLSPVWRKVIAETYRLYAATTPVRLWVEDDFRCYNHGPASFGCCCERHMTEFGKRIGKKVNREEFAQAILNPGKPHPWRALWLRFQEECMIDAATMIRKAVHAVSPSTQMGWMSITPFMVELEGRGFNAQVKAFAGSGTAAIRMQTTHFHEVNPRGMLIEDESLKKAICQLPAGTVRCTEIEACPHSLFTKSARWIEAQMAWACVLNVPNQTLNVFDYIGTPMSVTPNTPEMLRTRKKTLESIAQKFCGNSVFRGVGLISNPYSADYVHTSEGKKFVELLAKETGWADALRGFGIPIVCSDTEDVTAVTGQAFRRFSKSEIRKLFSRGVLLDLSALRVLAEMGLSRLVGVKLDAEFAQRSRAVGPEHLTDPAFGGGRHRFTWMYAVSDTRIIGILKAARGAHVISQILDPELKPICPGAVLYENELGGRVAVYPHDFSGKDPDEYNKGINNFFYSEYRKTQMQSVIRWLGKESVPLIVQANGWVLPHRSDVGSNVVLAAMNLNYDDWNGIKMECSVKGKVKQVQVMNPDGKWKTQNGNWKQTGVNFVLEIEGKVPTLRMVAAVLEL
ncbi:MAG: hypothetical protein WCP55_07905 [Lentisphaerota bacterium]